MATSEIQIAKPPPPSAEDDECPIKQVDITVPKTDDPTMPVLTFRMWVLGIAACVILSFVNQFFWYRSNPLSVSSIAAQIAVVPLGHLMAKTLPTRLFFKDSRFEFSMNPGPFNIKEHVLITIFANSGAGSVYATHILTAVKLLYKRELTFLPALLIMLTTQVFFLSSSSFCYHFWLISYLFMIWELEFGTVWSCDSRFQSKSRSIRILGFVSARM